ncbi:MAG: hypothetical protein KME26_06020 [Oscillatoria princeps RMCB-10]|jgi:hypothetical protein|nr:hypothetical protein [Oscillatoria princeps RMCB-10]
MAQISGHYKFAICLTSEGCDDLQVWKLYRLLPDVKAEVDDYLRWTILERITCTQLAGL